VAIYDQSYQPWKGTETGKLARIAAIAGTGVRIALKNRWAKILLILAFAPTLIFMTMIFITEKLRDETGFEVNLLAGNAAYQLLINQQLGFSVFVIAAVVGIPLISTDLRHNALAMYFSKAITRADYAVGKASVILTFLFAATLLPAASLLLGVVLFKKTGVPAADHLRDLLAIAGHSALVCVPVAAIAIGLSSLAKRGIFPGFGWAGIWFGSDIAAQVLHNVTRKQWPYALSLPEHVRHGATALYADRGGQMIGPFAEMVGKKIEGPPSQSIALLAAITVGFMALLVFRLRAFEREA
jgi:ABC-type transport system involved in multi-copper enzyme maturation permease subunit